MNHEPAIKQIIADIVGIPEDQTIENDDKLIDDLGMDEFDITAMISLIEILGLEVDQHIEHTWVTVGDVIRSFEK